MTRRALMQSLRSVYEHQLEMPSTEFDKRFRDAVLRVADAALKGGADSDEVWSVCYMAATRPAPSEQMGREQTLADARRQALKALRRVNAGREVQASERERLMRLSHELKGKFPKAAPRYREMARRLSTPNKEYKEGRIRYIIEGPRKAKKKT